MSYSKFSILPFSNWIQIVSQSYQSRLLLACRQWIAWWGPAGTSVFGRALPSSLYIPIIVVGQRARERAARRKRFIIVCVSSEGCRFVRAGRRWRASPGGRRTGTLRPCPARAGAPRRRDTGTGARAAPAPWCITHACSPALDDGACPNVGGTRC
jgi:hypothetical protein